MNNRRRRSPRFWSILTVILAAVMTVAGSIHAAERCPNPRCGRGVKASWKFCGYCRTPLRSASAGAPVQRRNSRRGELGMRLEKAPERLLRKLAIAGGAVVAGLVPGGPADAAGLRKGDVIISVAARPTISPAAVTQALQPFRPGETVEMGVYRKRERLSVNARVATVESAIGFNGQWMGRFGKAEMILVLHQDGYRAMGQLVIRGKDPLNEQIEARIDREGSLIQIKEGIGRRRALRLEGRKEGETLSGTYTVETKRGMLGRLPGLLRGLAPTRETTGRWTVYRKAS